MIRRARPKTYRISDTELASRLAFFLWSSLPDDELLDLASRSRLSRPAVLTQQVQRMLADPRSTALTKNFAGQWLYLRNLEIKDASTYEFPDFDDNLRRAFRTETEMLFDHIARNDRSVLELLTADYRSSTSGSRSTTVSRGSSAASSAGWQSPMLAARGSSAMAASCSSRRSRTEPRP